MEILKHMIVSFSPKDTLVLFYGHTFGVFFCFVLLLGLGLFRVTHNACCFSFVLPPQITFTWVRCTFLLNATTVFGLVYTS